MKPPLVGWKFRTWVTLISLSSMLVLPFGLEARASGMIQAYVLKQTIAGSKQVSYFDPARKRVRIELGDRTVLIDIKNQVSYWFTQQQPKSVSKVDFNHSKQAERAIRHANKEFGDGLVSEAFFQPLEWRWISAVLRTPMSDHEKEPCEKPRERVLLANQFREKKVMCVIRDPEIKKLEFFKEAYQNLPVHIQKITESSAEIFLYGEGVVPLLGTRRGLSFVTTMHGIKELPASLFEVAQEAKIRETGSSYRDTFLKSMQP